MENQDRLDGAFPPRQRQYRRLKPVQVVRYSTAAATVAASITITVGAVVILTAVSLMGVTPGGNVSVSGNGRWLFLTNSHGRGVIHSAHAWQVPHHQFLFHRRLAGARRSFAEREGWIKKNKQQLFASAAANHNEMEGNHERDSLLNLTRCWRVECVPNTSRRIDSDESPFHWRTQAIATPQQITKALTATWHWCIHFCARHTLCPWARASVTTARAVRLYQLDLKPRNNHENDDAVTTKQQAKAVVEQVAMDFVRDLEDSRGGHDNDDGVTEYMDPNSAISFVVFVPSAEDSKCSDHWTSDFASFYDWYLKLEDDWLLGDLVTLAPFHPDWTYGGSSLDDNDATLSLEKQSPYPVVSIVSTAVIDKAGPAATQQIAQHNQDVLEQKSLSEWKVIYRDAIEGKTCPRDTYNLDEDEAFQ